MDSPETLSPSPERDALLINIIVDYFKHYGIDPPSNLVDYEKKETKGMYGETEVIFEDYADTFTMFEEEWQTIMYSKNKAKIKSALKKFQDYAVKYHNEHTPKIPITGRERATIFKLMKLCTFGGRLNEMGIDGTTKQNLLNDFIAKPVLLELINILKKDPPRVDVQKLYPESNTRIFISNKLKELLK